MDKSENAVKKIQQKAEFKLKNEILDSVAKRVDADTFYSELFNDAFEPMGDYAIRDNGGEPTSYKSTGVGNPMVICPLEKNKRLTHIITEEHRHDFFEDYRMSKCALIAPVVFYGKTALAKNARYIYAIAIDLDYVGENELRSLLNQMTVAINPNTLLPVLPSPTFIVNSGTGLHLYYFFNSPLPAYPKTRTAIKNLKSALIRLIWNGYTSQAKPDPTNSDPSKKDPRQYQGAVQGYRVIGSLTKLGKGFHVTAFRYWKTWNPEDLNKYLLLEDKQYAITDDNCRYKSDLSLEKAKELYPDWYHKRIVEKKARGTFKSTTTKLYDWWFSQIQNGVKVGHRFHCIAMLAVYAKKSGIDDEQKVIEDAKSLVPYLNELGHGENDFTEQEAIKAVRSFFKAESATLPINSIIHLSGIEIKKNKRNGRKRANHVKLMNFVRDELNHNTDWRNKDGAPTKQSIVEHWRLEHPDGKKADCIRDTGLTKPTVYKWW